MSNLFRVSASCLPACVTNSLSCTRSARASHARTLINVNPFSCLCVPACLRHIFSEVLFSSPRRPWEGGKGEGGGGRRRRRRRRGREKETERKKERERKRYILSYTLLQISPLFCVSACLRACLPASQTFIRNIWQSDIIFGEATRAKPTGLFR